MNSEYIGYRISSATTYQDLWVSIENFSVGSVISLVNPADSPYPIGKITGGAATPTTTYFLLKASQSSNTPQKHDFKIYQGKPNGQAALYECTFTFTKVRETIKANPNKVTTVNFSTTTPVIGGTFVVSVLGDTGTIGSGSTPDADSIWLSPAPKSDWPTRSIRLERVDLLLDDSNSLKITDTCGTGNTCYQDKLIVNDLLGVATTLGGANNKSLKYIAKYTFRVIGRAPAFTFTPIALISSGTQMKHTPIATSGASTGSLDLSSVNTNLIISQKSITSATSSNLTTTTISGTTYLKVAYKIIVQNTGTSPAAIDAIKDTPDSNLLIDSTIATTLTSFTNLTTSAGQTSLTAPLVPSKISGSYTFTTPVTIAASGRVELTYTMLVPQCVGTTKSYSNYVVAIIGSISFGSSTAGFAPDATLNFNCGSTQLTSTASGSGTRIPMEVITNPANPVGNTSATLNGSVDSNGNSGQAIKFEYWKDLDNVFTVNASTSTTTTSTDPINVNYQIASGLTSGTVYYFRVIAGTYIGSTLSFITTEPVGPPTVTTNDPTSVSSTDAILNATVDPNQTPVYFIFQVYTSAAGSSATPYEFKVTDDVTSAYNASTNDYSQYGGSYPVTVSINMNLANLKTGGTSGTSLASLIGANRTVYYRAKLEAVTGSALTVAADWKSFTLTTYVDQTISWNSLPDIQWDDPKPTLSPSASSGMAVQITSDPSSTGCSYSGTTLTITSYGTCTLIADQSGGLKPGTTTYYNSVQEPITFNILRNEVTITADEQSKIYGEADPTFTYTQNWTKGNLKTGDNFSGSLSRAVGANVGTYSINQGNLALSDNYIITFNPANLTINAKPITVTAVAKSKFYGAGDPPLTYNPSVSLIGTDTFSGELTRVIGNSAGTYAILQGTLVLNSNYTLSYVGANFVINPLVITVVANNQTKKTDASDPTFTYTYSPSLISPDSFSGSLTRTDTRNILGNYTISQGTLALSANYSISFTAGTLTITDKIVPILTWPTPSAITFGTLLSNTQLNAVVSKPNVSDPDFTLFNCVYTPSSGNLPSAGTITLSVTCTPSDSDAAKYSSVSGTVSLVVNQKPITVTATAKNKIYGSTDPALVYEITSGSLESGDSFTGDISRATGENFGLYDIEQHDLSLSANYNLTYVPAKFTINKKDITATASELNKTFGESDPTLSYVVTGDLVGSDTFSGALARAPGSNVGSYLVSQNTLSLSSNYNLIYVSKNFTILARPVTYKADDQSKSAGDPDPTLTYQLVSGSLVSPDTASGTLSRTAGESAGTYTISQGSLAVTSNYTITFTPGTLTITGSTTSIFLNYNCNGGSGAPAAHSGSTGDVLSVKSNSCSYGGYTFRYWGTSSSGGTRYDPTDTFTLGASDSTLYAIWQVNSVTPNLNFIPQIFNIEFPDACSVEDELVITGINLSGATVTLNGRRLSVRSSTDSRISTAIPKNLRGNKKVIVTTNAGRSEKDVSLKSRAPLFEITLVPNLYRGTRTAFNFKAIGALKFTIIGNLPPGLSLNPQTGRVTGTPNKEGLFVFDLVASGDCDDETQEISLFVDKKIPNAISHRIKFKKNKKEIPSNVKDELEKFIEKAKKMSPENLDPVVFVSGGNGSGSPDPSDPEKVSQLADDRYNEICDLLLTMDLLAQKIAGAFTGPEDEIEIIIYWPTT
ncbi:MAG: MBG domain-containing protein [Candidatus Nanopelagicaceae bacterium]